MRIAPSRPVRWGAVAAAAWIAFVAVGPVAASEAWAGSAADTGRPSIVLITTDDQTLSSFGRRTMPATKRLLARRGTTFTNAIVTTPLCCPSRASILTGQYAHNHGVTSNRLGYAALRDKANTLPAWLARAGYVTAHVGKYLNGYESAAGSPAEVAPGWDLWFTAQGPTRYYDYGVSANGRQLHFGSRDRDHVTRVINRKARSLVRRLAPGPRPLYLQVDHRAPHTETGVNSGGRCGLRAVPDPRDTGRFPSARPPRSHSYDEADVSDKPSFIRARPPLDRVREKRLTQRWRCGQAALRGVDRGVRQLVAELRRAGELRRTVIAFTSDNGYFHGEHRIPVGKSYPYEEGIRVPLVFRVPGRTLGGGRAVPRVSAPVANIDLAPTFLDLAGTEPCTRAGGCRTMDGRSLVGTLSGDRGEMSRDRALALGFEFGRGLSQDDGLCAYAGLRTRELMYVEHTLATPPAAGCGAVHELELYDLDRDPFQLRNLAHTQGASALRSRLATRLEVLRACAGTSGRDRPQPGRPLCE